MSFKEHVLVAPVTALECIGDLVFAGIGPYVYMYDTSKRTTGKQVYHCKVLHDSNVHGLRADDNIAVHPDTNVDVCVFGGKSLRILNVRSDSFRNVHEIYTFNDWIWDVLWISNASETKHLIAVVQAHNQVIRYNPWTSQCLESIVCEEKCILYSARLIGGSWESLVVAAGTVFNQVVIWAPAGTPSGDSTCKQVLHRLHGHQGVIFGIQYRQQSQLLCSVSDDRSLRLWKCFFPTENKSCLSLEDWKNAQFELINVLYGHSARVWDSRILQHCIVSVGEDSTCCVWSTEGKIIAKLKGHKGKSIWSMAVSRDELSLITGGGDCSIREWSLQEIIENRNTTKTTALNIPNSTVDGAVISEADFPRIVKLKDSNSILVMTAEGKLLQYNILTKMWTCEMNDSAYQSYSVLSPHPNHSLDVVAVGNITGSISVLHAGRRLEQQLYSGKVLSIVWLCGSGSLQTGITLAATGPDGKLDLWCLTINEHGLHMEQQYSFTLPRCKQRWISAGCLLEQDGLIVCGDRGGTVHVYRLNKQSTLPEESFVKVHGKAGVTDIKCKEDNMLYSCGRDGTYCQYVVHGGHVSLLNQNKVLKGVEWLARLIFLDDCMLITAFHGDEFIIHSLDEESQTLARIECGGGHRSWDFCLHDETDDIPSDASEPVAATCARFVYIKNKEILVNDCSVNQGHTSLKVPLHGREVLCIQHLHSYQHVDGEVHICATGSEDTRINIISWSYSQQSNKWEMSNLASISGHISSVRALTSNKSSPGARILFSGGGRAQLRAWKISCNKNHECSTEDTGNNLCLDAGHNGSMPVSESQTSSSGTSVFSKVQYEALASHMLTEKGLKKRKVGKQTDVELDPETRYMALTSFVFTLDSHLHWVGAACSDGMLRIFALDENSKVFKPVGISSNSGNCLLTITHLKMLTCTAEHALIFTGSTNGSVSLWTTQTLRQQVSRCMSVCNHCQSANCTSVSKDQQYVHVVSTGRHQQRHHTYTCTVCGEPFRFNMEAVALEPHYVFKQLHQSGVNSLDVKEIDEHECCDPESHNFIMVTGGDDNVQCYTRFTVVETKSGKVSVTEQKSMVLSSEFFSAQITGTKLLDSSTVLAVSVDQRMLLSHLDLVEDIQVKQKARKFVHVADVAGLETWKFGSKQYAVLCGVGMQLMEVASEDNRLSI